MALSLFPRYKKLKFLCFTNAALQNCSYRRLHILLSKANKQPKRVAVGAQLSKSIHGPQTTENEFVDVAQYPEIKRFNSRDEEEEAKLVNLVKNLKTVEEKLWYINKPKYYGWQSTVIDASWIRPASLDLVQYITNTTIVENELPPMYNLKTSSGRELDVLEGEGRVKKSDALFSGESQSNALSTFSSAPLETRAKAALEILEPLIKDYISDYECNLQNGFEVENDKILHHEREAFATEELHMTKQRKITTFVNGIHKLVMAYLAADVNLNAAHLSLDEATVDYLPRNEAFWFRGPMDADLRMVRKREGYEKAMAKRKGLPQYKLDQEKIHAPHDRAIQVTPLCNTLYIHICNIKIIFALIM